MMNKGGTNVDDLAAATKQESFIEPAASAWLELGGLRPARAPLRFQTPKELFAVTLATLGAAALVDLLTARRWRRAIWPSIATGLARSHCGVTCCNRDGAQLCFVR